MVSREGYQEARRTVTLSANQRRVEEFVLEPVRGLVLVHSEPEGAEVTLNGSFVGRTPLFLHDAPLGEHRMDFRLDGFQPRQVTLRVDGRIPQKVNVDLTTDSATVSFRSMPPGATVVLNGGRRGVTPLTVERVPQGEAEVEIVLDGHQPYRERLRLNAGDNVTVRAELIPIPGGLRVVSIPGQARIYVDNEFRGEAPVELAGLPPGEYRVRAELRGHETVARTIQIRRGEERTEEFRLERNAGTLRLVTEPAGVQVLISGEEMGVTRPGDSDVLSEPLAIDMLPPGQHRLQLVKEGFVHRPVEFVIRPNQVTTLHQRMDRMFIVNYQVRTEGNVWRGMFHERRPDGTIRLEVRRGIFRNFSPDEILDHGPLEAAPSPGGDP